MKSFFKEAFRTIKTSGTIRPSSNRLVQNCLKGLDFDGAKTVFEFGPGDGCFTKKILDNLNDDAKLISLEINQSFYQHCIEKFSTNKTVKFVKKSALDFDKELNTLAARNIDIIISSLPLSLLEDSEVDELMNKVYKHLKDGGMFVQYQYSLGKYSKLKEIFDRVDVNLTIQNLPPAFVYKCHKFGKTLSANSLELNQEFKLDDMGV